VIGVDSNILVRYLTQDDPVQYPKAKAFLESLTDASPGYLSLVVVAETAWVLERTYKFPDDAIALAMLTTISALNLVVQDDEAVVHALHAARDGRGTFADALIGVLAANAGCSRTATFDKRASRLPGFELL
jgi:predicted nucleic-acid-binding protein